MAPVVGNELNNSLHNSFLRVGTIGETGDFVYFLGPTKQIYFVRKGLMERTSLACQSIER
jgi:hypothetical protein